MRFLNARASYINWPGEYMLNHALESTAICHNLSRYYCTTRSLQFEAVSLMIAVDTLIEFHTHPY